MASSTDIEKKSLEAHVELCAERYANLENKLDNLETRMDKMEKYILEIRNSLSGSENNQFKTIIAVGTTLMGALVAGAITLIVHLK
jgi:predicted  nucleic acid-binding Zn-ribbon protein